jgi:hypothetical protein
MSDASCGNMDELNRTGMHKTIFLHIGTFKTGTSSIQQYLHTHAEELEAQGYFVPRGQLIGHHDLPLSLIKRYTPFRAEWPSFSGDSESIWGGVLSQIETSRCEKIVISSENFCDLVNEHVRRQGEQLRNALKSYLQPYKIRVIVYLRKLDAYAQSMYGEVVKVSTKWASLDDMVRTYIKHDSIHVHPSRYLDFYADAFGKENVTVKLYSSETLRGGDVVMDFLRTIGVKVQEDIMDRKLQANVSLSEESVLLKRVFNLSGPSGYEMNKQISNLLISLDRINSQTVNALDEDAVRQLRTEAEYIRRNYGIDIKPSADFELSEAGKVSGTDGFLIALLGKLIKQNSNLISRINRIEKKLALNRPEEGDR